MIVKRFAEQVRKNSDKLAVKTENSSLTYKQLDQRANEVACKILHEYKEAKIQGDNIVLLFEHGTDMIVSTIAALKAGKIYIPFDPSYPEKRLLNMLEDSEAKLLVTNIKNMEKAQKLISLNSYAIKIVNIDEQGEADNSLDWSSNRREDDIAYLLYTSGSTGKPKGVIQTHTNVLYFIENYAKRLSITEMDRLTLFSTFGHDAAVMDIYGGLLKGATLYPLNLKEHLNPERLVEWLNNEKITIWHSVPTFYRRFITTLQGSYDFPDLRLIVLGGEIIREHDVIMYKKFFPHATLVNLYGQSESSYNSSQLINQDIPFEKIVLGEPLDETKILLVGENGKKVAPLRIGEIVIVSEHIARGYWKNEEQTKKVFTSHPKLGRLYWTGDQGRLLLDGNIEFVGRKDFQVKVRGFRIEPGEVESHLLNHPSIREVVVVGREDKDGDICLCAYFVSDSKHTDWELREFLGRELPEYMIPSYFMAMESIPMTVTGKVDRGVLPDLTIAIRNSIEYIPPRNEIEEKLVAIWSDILSDEKIGIDDDFFSLGGHSLKATILVSKIFKELNVELLLGDIFRYPTIRQLGERIEKSEKGIYTSLQPIAEKDYYEVSSAQRRMFILNQLEEINTSYNMPKVMKIEGTLDRQRLEQTMKAIIKRHETLRTSFKIVEGEIVQFIHPDPDFTVTYIEAEESSVPEIVKQFVQPFNLNKAPLLRVGLIKTAEEKHVLFFDMHHIISDGTSIGILITEFVSLYAGIEQPTLPIQYKDFAAWQNEIFKTGVIEKQEQYWLETFAGEIPVLNLSTDYPRSAMQSFDGNLITFEADREMSDKLNALARDTGTTLYMVLLAAYNLLLSKYAGQEDIVVGSPIAGRSHADLQNIIGIFINSLAMRNHPVKEKRFNEFLKEVKANSIKAYENQDYQFEQLVERLDVKRQLDRNPLFDTMFILQNTESSETSIENLHFSSYDNPQTVAKLDLTLNAVEVYNKINFGIEYCTKLFTQETIEKFAGHFTNILRKITENPELKIAEIDMLSREEREQILQKFNNTKAEYPKDRMIHELFEEKVKLRPDNTALVFEEQKLTYQEFNEKANQLARRLRKQGVKPDSIVAIVTKRSVEMLIGIFAVLKAGGAYLPIDFDYPQERIKYILKDSQTEIVLTQKKVLEEGGLVVDCETICLDDHEIYQGETTDLEPVSVPENLAYIIYTSGSTGKPKGVMIEHRSVNNFIKGITDKINFTADKSILALTTISFDIFGLETLLPLTQGLKVVIANDEHQKDPKALKMVIVNNDIDMLQMTPSRMRMILNDDQSASCLKNVKEIMVGGEALPQDLLEEIKSVTKARIYNMYGPTETTIWVTVKDLTETTEVTIGKPIANTGIYILGPSNQLQPIGVPGELCVVGDSLAREYWKWPELTAEKFVPNPFQDQQELSVSGEKMYRTGDLVKWLPNGEIEFLGRTDEQVKIRGFRIELGEIESQLVKHEAVKETVVVAKKDNNGGKYLCTYIVGEGELQVPELKAHLSKELPNYMVPTHFIQLEKMPYTPNGKIDRKALPEPNAGTVSGVEYVAPTTEIEEKLIQIWHEVLGIEGIGINHNFFDIGGNSINIIKVISLISKRMGVQVSMSELFLWPTVAEMAQTMFIENPLKGLECVISLNKPTEGKKNVFILHTWEGIVYQYKELAKILEGEYNIYGIQAKGVVKPAKLPETLDEMLTDYICEIKTIQPEGPYIIAGYCYGNWIAYKMVQMLEDQDVPIDRMIQIDENAYMPDKTRKLIRVKTVVSKPYRFIRKWVRKLITWRNMNPMDYWPDLEDYKKSKSQIEGEIKNERTVREHVNYLCTVGYSLKYIISTDTYIIKAEENNLVRYTPEDWKKQTYGKVWFVEIPGGHESIFAYPYVEGLAKAFKRAIEE
ncbi:MAG: amino acid adenylation domain-containing protein [Halanaerobiales bacterium]|nr:amino acid adenylation domain-containing protein [Halanaerobiales bacterium]